MNLISPCSVLELCRDKILVFSPKYRGKVLEGEVAEAAEEIIRETCKELDIELIDLAGKWWKSIYRDRRVTR